MTAIRIFFPVNVLSYFAEHPMVWLRWDSLGVPPTMPVAEIRRALARVDRGAASSWVPNARLFRILDGVEATDGVLSDEAGMGYVAVTASEALPAFVRGLRLRLRNDLAAGEPTAEDREEGDRFALRAQLARLLRSLYTDPAEISALLQTFAGPLDGPEDTPLELFDVIRRLDREGAIGRVFFLELRGAHPARKREIRRFSRVWTRNTP